MSMRDLILLAALLASMVWALRKPWIGIIAWTVVSIMNPHTLAYWLIDQPVAASVALCTMIGVLMASPGEKHFPWTGESITLMLLTVWYCITWFFSFDTAASFEMLKKVTKINFMVLLALYVLHSKKHIETLVWALVVSIGFYGVKGGAFTIATGGNYRVWGPVSTYIEGNNEVALAIIVTIPLMRYLQLQTSERWYRHAWTVAMFLMAAAAIGSHSRGALLAILAMAFVMWLRSSNKIPTVLISVIFGVALINFMPEHWTNRMETIQTYREDESAMGRINAWWMAFNLAKDNFFGGGFSIYNLKIFGMYAPNPTAVHAAHSIYFQVLGEHGFVGLGLFLILFGLTWRSASWLRKHAAVNPEARWTGDLGAMCQVSLVGYAVGGAFLSLSYFDLPYNIMALVVLSKVWVQKKAWLAEAAAQPAQTPRKKPVRWT